MSRFCKGLGSFCDWGQMLLIRAAEKNDCLCCKGRWTLFLNNGLKNDGSFTFFSNTVCISLM